MFWVHFCLLCVSSAHCMSSFMMGPFNIAMSHFEECDNIGSGAFRFSLRTHRFNRTALVADLNVTLHVPFDDNISIQLAIALHSHSGGYKNNFFNFKVAKGCTDSYNVVPTVVKELLGALKYSNCPIQKGFYALKDFTTKEDVTKRLSFMVYGKYKAASSFNRHGKLVGCFNSYFDVVPKKMSHRGVI